MSLTCSISGEAAEVPVVSSASGHVFEKRIILKWIAENGKDPISNEPLSEDQLIELKVASTISQPKNLSTTSIPGLLKAFQDEWDSLTLNSFNLREQLRVARQELSHSLYQHDAACRVISRLSKELATAREALSTLKPHDVSKPNDVEMEESESTGINEAVIKVIDDKAKELTAERKQRGKALPEALAKQDELAGIKQTAVHTGIHSTGTPGITALDVKGSLALTGGVDKAVVLFDYEKEEIVQTFKGHTKKINAVILHQNKTTAVSASADSQIRVWDTSDTTAKQIIGVHSAPVTDISLNATGGFILSSSDDSYWAFSDINTGKTLCKVTADQSSQTAIHCVEFHPDGLIFGTGTADSVVKVWDLKSQTTAANFPGHTAAVRSISFSENGYYLATGSDDGEVKLWDLRKLKNLKTFTTETSSAVNNLSFDLTGSYLSVGGQKLHILHVKSWQTIAELTDNTAAVTGVRFGTNARSLVSTSLDKSLRIFSI